MSINMYGFKGTDKDMKCRGFQYTLQIEYKHEGKFFICESGFHLCKELVNVFTYYSPNDGDRFFIVKHGENYMQERDKLVTDNIVFVEEITPEFILNYNEKKIPDFDFLHLNLNGLLLWASANGHLEVVKFLINNGANIHFNDNHALRYASRNGQLETVKYLVSVGANIHADSEWALRYACANGQLETVKYLVSTGANIHALQNYALGLACEHGHLEVVKFLVESGANIHDDSDYALRWAEVSGRREVIEYLKSQIKNK